MDIQKRTIKTIHSCRITCECSESARERRIALYKKVINNKPWNLWYFHDLVDVINNHTKCHIKLDKKYDYSLNWCCHNLEIGPVVPSCKSLTFSVSTKNAALRFWHLQMVSQQAKPHHDHYILAFFMESKPVTCHSTSVHISLCPKCIQKTHYTSYSAAFHSAYCIMWKYCTYWINTPKTQH